MRTLEASPLEYVLLGLLGQGPRSGYDLRKVFTLTPLRHHSDSPGAVYPALRRLQRRRWIDAAPTAGGRRRQELRLNDRGRAAFEAWLRRPITRDDVIRRGSELLMRFALMGGILDASAQASFLRQYRNEMRVYLETLKGFHERNAAAMSLTGRLAFEQGIGQYQLCTQWASQALATVERAGEDAAVKTPRHTRARAGREKSSGTE
jgi:DNA-binding PadR family transcriptional regulator